MDVMWLRSPRTNTSNPVNRAGIVVCSDGVINSNGNNVNNTNGVRPIYLKPETKSRKTGQSKVKEQVSLLK